MNATLNPGEVLERFRDELVTGRGDVSSSERKAAASAEALEVASDIHGINVKDAETARSDQVSREHKVVGMIEAAGDDIDGRDVVETTMLAKGKSESEVKEYFEHIKRIEGEEQQPIIIIARDEKELGVSGLISVVYGMTPGLRGDTRVRLSRNEEGPGSRDVTIPVRSARGFSFDGISCTKLFAQLQGHEFNQATLANNGYPFEDVHFAGSAEKVKYVVESGSDSGSQAADDVATRVLGLPTIVAYGEDAVLEVSEQIREHGDLLEVLDRRSMEGIGIDLTDVRPDLEIPGALMEGLGASLTRAVSDMLQRMPETGENEELAFLGPLQRRLGIGSDFLITLASLNAGAMGRDIDDNLGELAKMGAALEAHGLDIDEKRIVAGAKSMQRSALLSEFANTSMIRLIKRQRLAQALRRLDVDS